MKCRLPERRKTGLQPAAGKSAANGFALHQALAVLFFLGQLCGLLCLMTVQSAQARLALQQSRLDLEIIQEARSMARDMIWQRRCQPAQPLQAKTVSLSQGELYMEDYQTFLLLRHVRPGRSDTMRFYYDETGFYSLEHERKPLEDQTGQPAESRVKQTG